MKDQYEAVKAQQELDRMADIAYDQYCNLQVAIDALNQIVDAPNKIASDTRALKEIVRIATWALNIIEEDKIAELPS